MTVLDTIYLARLSKRQGSPLEANGCRLFNAYKDGASSIPTITRSKGLASLQIPCRSNSIPKRLSKRAVRSLRYTKQSSGHNVATPEADFCDLKSWLPGIFQHERVWCCCECDNGPMVVAHNLKCDNCGHKRCSSCDMDEVDFSGTKILAEIP